MGILEVRDVNKNFGGLKALHNVNLDVQEGSVHAIIGPNGAGKSTLLNCFIGRLTPDTGSVMFNGSSLLGLKPHEINQAGVVRVQGDVLPHTQLAEWQATNRFARVALHGNFLVHEMDLLAAGGVTRGHLAVSLQLWTQMMGEFFVFLRNQHTAAAAEAPDEERAAD